MMLLIFTIMHEVSINIQTSWIFDIWSTREEDEIQRLGLINLIQNIVILEEIEKTPSTVTWDTLLPVYI